MLADLRSFDYAPPDDARAKVLEVILNVFNPQRIRGMDTRERLAAADALGRVGDPRIREPNWVTLPAGSFIIGSQNSDPFQPNFDREAEDTDYPIQRIELKQFEISRYLTTVKEYEAFVNDDGYQKECFWAAGGFGRKKEPDRWEEQALHPNRPVVLLSWYEAAAYCAWSRTRLPTDVEWERAARGSDSRKYPWGNDPPDANRANYLVTNIGLATPVGLFPHSSTPDGIEDMCGNVWEWTADLSQNGAIVRGGSWLSEAKYLRAAFRGQMTPEYSYDYIGFRCAR